MLIATHQLSNLKVFQHINTEQIQRKSLETIVGRSTRTFKDDNSAECSGDINFTGGGAGNVIKSDVTQGDINFTGGGIANVIKHNSNYGNTNFYWRRRSQHHCKKVKEET